MVRNANRFPTSHLKLSTTPQVLNRLDKLVERGLHGKTRSEVAEELLRQQLIQLELPFKRGRKGPQPAKQQPMTRKRRAS